MKRNVLLIIVAGVMGLLLIFKFDALLTENSQLKGDNLALKKSVISHQDAIEHYQEELARLSELDKQHTKALTDAKMILAGLMMSCAIILNGCTSKPIAPTPIITPPPPPAWVMQPRTTYRNS